MAIVVVSVQLYVLLADTVLVVVVSATYVGELHWIHDRFV